MKNLRLARRTFLATATAAGAAALSGCPPGDQRSVVVYRRSGRGRHVSNAAKKHNANHVYADALVAALDKAHPGDNSKVVPITVSRAEYNRLFGNGGFIADLRHARKRAPHRRA